MWFTKKNINSIDCWAKYHNGCLPRIINQQKYYLFSFFLQFWTKWEKNCFRNKNIYSMHTIVLGFTHRKKNLRILFLSKITLFKIFSVCIVYSNTFRDKGIEMIMLWFKKLYNWKVSILNCISSKNVFLVLIRTVT